MSDRKGTNEAMRRAAEGYSRELAEVLGPRLRSVVLHGSVARGEAVKGVSDVNLLVLLDDVDAGVLRTLAPHARRWLEKERALPLVLTAKEWAAASDVFAIETADMLEHRTVLHGDDPLEGVRVERRHLRLQAERELRGKLIQLREGTLASADRPEELGRLLLTALPSLATYLRAALRLEEGDSSRQGDRETAGPSGGVDWKTPAVLGRGAALVGADPDPLIELWELRSKRKPPRMEVGDPKATAVHDVLERTVAYVDQLSGERT